MDPFNNSAYSYPKRFGSKTRRGIRAFDHQQFSEDVEGQLRTCEAKLKTFRREYFIWERTRQDTLEKLQELKNKIHEQQLSFNKFNYTCKNINQCVRDADLRQTELGTFASIATLFTDAVSSVTSIAQACNIDACVAEFKEIMEKDASHTESFYAARSRCLSGYAGVEEIVRSYHFQTVGSIAVSLRIGDLWSELRVALDKRDCLALLSSLDDYFSRDLCPGALDLASSCVREYLDINPATADACLSVGLTALDALELWREKSRKDSQALEVATMASKSIILREDRKRFRELGDVVQNESQPQAKFELKIQDAINSLASEYGKLRNEFRFSDTFKSISKTDEMPA